MAAFSFFHAQSEIMFAVAITSTRLAKVPKEKIPAPRILKGPSTVYTTIEPELPSIERTQTCNSPIVATLGYPFGMTTKFPTMGGEMAPRPSTTLKIPSSRPEVSLSTNAR